MAIHTYASAQEKSMAWPTAVRHLLEADGQAAARGVFDRLLDPVVEIVVLQAATGR